MKMNTKKQILIIKKLLLMLGILTVTSLYCPGPKSGIILKPADELFCRNFNPGDPENNRQLLNAVSNDNTNFVRALLELGVSPNIGNIIGSCPLHMAIQNDNPTMVRILIDFGANPNAQTADNLRLTPLHIATHNGNLEIVTLLLGTQTIHPFLQNSRGETPLTVVRGDNTEEIKEAFKAYERRFIQEASQAEEEYKQYEE